MSDPRLRFPIGSHVRVDGTSKPAVVAGWHATNDEWLSVIYKGSEECVCEWVGDLTLIHPLELLADVSK